MLLLFGALLLLAAQQPVDAAFDALLDRLLARPRLHLARILLLEVLPRVIFLPEAHILKRQRNLGILILAILRVIVGILIVLGREVVIGRCGRVNQGLNVDALGSLMLEIHACKIGVIDIHLANGLV